MSREVCVEFVYNSLYGLNLYQIDVWYLYKHIRVLFEGQ